MTSPENDQPGREDVDGAGSERRPVAVRLGVGLILISGVLWFSLFAVPFLPLSVGQKTVVAGALFVGVQLAWWSGAALAGPAVVRKFTGGFRRSSTAASEESSTKPD